MLNNVNILIKLDIQDILKSPEYSVLLKKTYSDLYLGGADCRSCHSSLIGYHRQLQINGIMKAEENNICKCKLKGLKYYTNLHKHINLETISDKDAIYLLEKGMLKESDFTILPVMEQKKEVKASKKNKKYSK